MVWHNMRVSLQQIKRQRAMLEIILSVSLYAGAVALLVKCAIAYCENSHDNIVTEP